MEDFLKYLLQILFGTSGFATTVFVALLGADSMLSKEKSEYYSNLLKANFTTARQSLYIVDIFYGPNRPAKAFLLTSLYVTIVGLAGAILQYVLWVEGFWQQLTSDDLPRQVFFRQIWTTGVPIVLLTNITAGMVFAAVRGIGDGRATGLQYLLFDLLVRFAVFTALMAVTYIGSAAIFGSFGGNMEVALHAVWPTLIGAFEFENLTSAYLLATILGGVPIFASAAVDLSERSPIFRGILRSIFGHLPVSKKPILMVGVVFAAMAYLVFQFGALVVS